MKKLLIAILFLLLTITTCFYVGCKNNVSDIPIQVDSKEYKDYKIPPIINIDFGDYSIDEIPNAVIDKDYKIFNATAHDIYSRVLDVNVLLYKFYYSENKYLLNIENNCFKPSEYGVYTIEYSAEDVFGNRKVLTIDVACSAVEKLSATLSAKNENGVVGQTIELADISVENNIGNVNVTTIAKLKNSNIVLDLTGENEFEPEYSGVYEIVYTYSDYNCVDEIKYEITVTSSEKPIIGKIAVPKYFIAGVSYEIPMPEKCFYSENGKKYDIVPSVYLKEKNDPDMIKLKGKLLVENEGEVEIIYQAEFNGLIETVSYQSLVVDTGLFDELKMENYFQGNNIFKTATKDDVIITTVTDGAGFNFIRSLPNDVVRFVFGVDSIDNNYDRVDFYLFDSLDVNNRIKVSFERFGQESKVLVNDGEFSKTSFGFEKLARTEFNYNNKQRSVNIGDSAKLEITNTVNGNKFNGFNGDINIEVCFGDVSGYSSLHVFQINNQSFYKEYGDGVSPYVIFNKYSNSTLRVGDTVELERIFVSDVLDPTCYVDYYVKAPDGSFVKDINGNVLDSTCDYTKNQIFVADQIGNYLVYIGVKDSAGNEEFYSYGFNVRGKNAVSIHLGEGSTKISIGNSITLKSLEVIKLQENIEYSVFVYVLCPDMIMDVVQGGNGATYTPDLIGEYKVFYVVTDSNGEINTINYTFTVS